MDARRLIGGSPAMRDGAFVPSVADLYGFAALRGLDEADARDWWDWVSGGGEPPARSWQGSVINFCARRRREREAAKRQGEQHEKWQ